MPQLPKIYRNGVGCLTALLGIRIAEGKHRGLEIATLADAFEGDFHIQYRRMIAAAMTPSPTVGSVDYCYSTGPLMNLTQCDACPCCRDTCANAKSCIACQNKQSTSSSSMPVLNSNWLAG